MPSNPMQRKVRNSFLLGILTMLLLVILIGVIVFLLVLKPKMDKEKAEAAVEYVTVCKLTKNIKSGEEIPAGAIEKIDLPKANVPADAVTTFSGGMAKVNLTAGTVLSKNLITEDESDLDESLRLVEYNMITLPITIEPGDTIDVRITFENGQDLIVLSKKVVQDIQENTILLNLTEGEILTMNSAIVEAYIMTTSNLYIARYTEPGMQEASKPTYVPTQEVQNLIASDPNISSEARTTLTNRYISGLRDGYINTQLEQYAEERKLNLETKVLEQIESARTARENYLSGMSGV